MKPIRHTTLIALAALAVAGAGCSRQEPVATPVVPSVAENRVLTVDEYLKQPELRKRVFSACANDPGRKGGDPNCVNALRAERIASSGSGNFPSLAR